MISQGQDSVELVPNTGWDKRMLVCRCGSLVDTFIVVTSHYLVFVDTLINAATAKALLALAEPTTASLYPEVSLLPAQPRQPEGSTGAPVVAPLQLATVIPQAVPHVSIEIRDVAQRQPVTAIEILSPTNKRGEGRIEYLTKRRRLLLSSAHVIELDFLRDGGRVPMQERLPEVSYFVFLSRAERRPVLDIWPVALNQTLPEVPAPLLAGDSDLMLDLQATFIATYDLLGYNLLIDYARPPTPPLEVEQAQWAAQLLSERKPGDTPGA